MTKTGWLAVLVFALLLVPMVQAHGAPKQKEYQTRLIGDCEDDLAAADEYGGPGYDLHALDTWEAWSGSQHLTWFRVVANGGGAATITLNFDAGSEKSYSWVTTNGNTWTLAGFTAGGYREDVFTAGDPAQGRDGNRFALEGAVPTSSLGGIGAEISGFSVASEDSGWDDEMPGQNGVATSCVKPFGPAPKYVLQGPVRYASLKIVPPEDLLSDVQNIGSIEVTSRLQTESQTFTLAITGHQGTATVRLHDPSASSGDGYSQSVTQPLGKLGNAGSKKIVHLAIEGPGGAIGTVSLTMTTDLGGRVVDTYTYSIPEDDTPVDPAPVDPGDKKPTPSLGVPLMVALFAAIAMRRRR